jgi:dipeptidase E
MSENRVLVFSSSRVGNGAFMESLIPVIKNFLEDTELKIAFIPFASVSEDYDDYTSMVRAGLGTLPYQIKTVTAEKARSVIRESDVIMVGGGNTFKLLHDLYNYELLDCIRDKVFSGTPYIGWSAGANITSPTISTTNDMPVIEPKSFTALSLLPFQINPHYTNLKVAGHNGETRDQRLQEFLMLNPAIPIVALPEGTALQLSDGRLKFIGDEAGVLFDSGEEGQTTRRLITGKEDLSFLLRGPQKSATFDQ